MAKTYGFVVETSTTALYGDGGPEGYGRLGCVSACRRVLNVWSRSLCRRLAGVSRAGSPPVVLVDGAQPPTLAGESFHYTTKTGKPVYYRRAYAKVGWSSLVYHGSTRRVEVGRDWRPEEAR